MRERGIKPKSEQPTEKTDRDDEQVFRVWANRPTYLEDQDAWKCLATFNYLTECLDYIAYCQDNGSDVLFQSPADCKVVKASERRVVYKPERNGGQ